MRGMHAIEITLVFIVATLFSGALPPHSLFPKLEEELANLNQRGFSYRFIDHGVIEIHNNITGEHWLMNLAGPIEAEIHAWANARGVPILEIDPSQIDTNLYSSMYTYWTTVPVVGYGIPMVAGDVDRNGKPELYGYYYRLGQYDEYYTRVYEIDSTGQSFLRHDYGLQAGTPRHIVDTDRDGLLEIMIDSSRFTHNYRQAVIDSLPVVRNFTHRKFSIGVVSEKQYVGLLDQDSLLDFLYTGDVSDTIGGGAGLKQHVVEYNPVVNDFERRWSTDFGGARRGTWAFMGYGVGDFDGDEKMEFTVSSLWGNLWVTENTANDSYAVVWEDSLPFVNMYWNTAGDVDNDGKIEFFVGATVFSSGTWTVVFEADSDNHYSPTFMIHYLDASFDYPTYTTTDVDNDGKLELILMIAGSVMIFKSDSDNSYYLWYYKHFNYGDTMLPYNFVGDQKLKLAVSLTFTDMQPRDQTQIWRLSGLTGFKNPTDANIPQGYVLYQNFPDPFNPSTTLSFDLPKRAHIRLLIYDILGRLVSVLADGIQERGHHQARWDAEGFPSGVYVYQLQTEDVTLTKKMVLVR